MRIAYLVNHYPAVSHSFIRREIVALEGQGFEVVRLALRGWSGPLADPADVREREHTRFVLRRGLMPLVLALLASLLGRPRVTVAALVQAVRMAEGSERSLPYHLAYLLEACRVAAWLRESGVAHLHAHFGTNSAEVAMLASILSGVGYSFTVHGPDEFDRPRALGLAEKARRAAFVIGISSFTRSQLYRWLDVADWDRVHVVHCGLDAAYRDGTEAAVGSTRRLVCIGRFSEQKGHFLLLSAMRRVFDRGTTFELVLVGDGELRGAIEARAAVLGLQGHVRVTGWVSGADVRAELLSARALVLPSFAEGLPVVIMEAMALSRPVISTYVAGIPELVENGRSGWLAPAGDAAALADAIATCLGLDASELAAMGEQARVRVLGRHDVDVEAAKLASLFARHASRAGIARGD